MGGENDRIIDQAVFVHLDIYVSRLFWTFIITYVRPKHIIVGLSVSVRWDSAKKHLAHRHWNKRTSYVDGVELSIFFLVSWYLLRLAVLPDREKVDTSMICSYCATHFKTFQEMTQHVIAESIKVDFHNHDAATRQANSMMASHNPFHHLHAEHESHDIAARVLNVTTCLMHFCSLN